VLFVFLMATRRKHTAQLDSRRVFCGSSGALALDIGGERRMTKLVGGVGERSASSGMLRISDYIVSDSHRPFRAGILRASVPNCAAL